MPKSYCANIVDEANTVKACISNAKVSFKNTHETCSTLRGRTIGDCIRYLNNVLVKKECVPMRRFSSGCPNTRQARHFSTPEKPCTQGRWPKNSCETMLKLLNNIKTNAKNKNLDGEELVVDMVCVNRAPKIHGRVFRAHGRVNPFNKSPCHIQMVAVRKGQEVPADAAIVEIDE